jgi:hypothetical protein
VKRLTNRVIDFIAALLVAFLVFGFGLREGVEIGESNAVAKLADIVCAEVVK